jgi:hypothetical protein
MEREGIVKEVDSVLKELCLLNKEEAYFDKLEEEIMSYYEEV